MLTLIFGLIFVAASVNYSYGLPLGEENFSTKEYLNENDGINGKYKYSYITSNDIAQQQEGELSPADGILRVKGSYSYMTPDGNTHFVDYTADENGYRAKTRTEPGSGSGQSSNALPPLPPYQTTTKKTPVESEISAPVPIIGSAVLGSLAG